MEHLAQDNLGCVYDRSKAVTYSTLKANWPTTRNIIADVEPTWPPGSPLMRLAILQNWYTR